MSLTGRMLRATFDGAVPPVVGELVRTEVADALVEDFKVGPILPFDGDRPVRVAVSDEAEPARWDRVVRGRWPEAGPFLDAGPRGCRRMLDTDGERAWVYLDDLQDHGVRAPSWLDAPLICLTREVGGPLTCVSRHETLPMDRLSEPLARRARDLLALGAVGLWGIRWHGRRPVSLLWVSESRWRENARESAAIVEQLGGHPAWGRLRGVLEGDGCIAYPDAVELFGDGRVDVTVGVVAG